MNTKNDSEFYEENDVFFLNSVYNGQNCKDICQVMRIFRKYDLLKQEKIVQIEMMMPEYFEFDRLIIKLKEIQLKSDEKRVFKYIEDEDLEYFDLILQKLNVDNRDHYIYIIKLLNDIFLESIDEKLHIKPTKSNLLHTINCFDFFMNCIINEDEKSMKLSRAQKFEIFAEVKDMMLKKVSKLIETTDSFNLINVINSIADSYNKLKKIPIKSYTSYEEMCNAKVFVFFLNEEFVNSNNFKINLNKARLFGKKIIFAKLENFDNSSLDFHVNYDDVEIYELHRHKNHDFLGYITRRLVKSIENHLHKKSSVSFLIIY